MDKLKEYLFRHKAGLDVDSPAGDTWDHIQSEMPDESYRTGSATKPAFPMRVIRYAAAACIIALAGIGLWLVFKENKAPADTAKAKIEDSSRTEEKSQDEIEAIDKSYSSLISYQLKKLRATPLYAENGNYFSFYVQQFKQMDKDEQDVRKDIKTYGLTNEFLEQLINVYQQKLNVLKNLQTEINKMNNKVRGKEAPSAIRKVHYLNI